MKTTKRITLLSALVMLTLILSGCYTRLGAVQRDSGYTETEEAVYEDYNNYDSDADEAVVVHQYHYIPRYYSRFYYVYDPWDYWYYEPGFYFHIGFYSGPARYYIYDPYWYYPYPVVTCPPAFPGWYYAPVYVYNDHYYQRRGFSKRSHYPIAGNRRYARDLKSYDYGRGTLAARGSSSYASRTDDKDRSNRIAKRPAVRKSSPDPTYHSRTADKRSQDMDATRLKKDKRENRSRSGSPTSGTVRQNQTESRQGTGSAVRRATGNKRDSSTGSVNKNSSSRSRTSSGTSVRRSTSSQRNSSSGSAVKKSSDSDRSRSSSSSVKRSSSGNSGKSYSPAPSRSSSSGNRVTKPSNSSDSSKGSKSSSSRSSRGRR